MRATRCKPVEGWTRQQIRVYSEAAGAYPIGDYLPRIEPWPNGVSPMVYSWPRATRGNVSGAPRDDDVDYTLLGLELLELDRARAWRWRHRQVTDRLGNLPGGGNPIHGLLAWEEAEILENLRGSRPIRSTAKYLMDGIQ